jgi:hypothetical protein
VLLGLGALLLIGGILVGGLVAVVVLRPNGGGPVGAAPTVTAVAVSTQVVVIPTVTPGPTDTATPEPTETEEVTETPEVEASPTEAEATATEVVDFLTVDVGANVRTGPAVAYPVVANLAAGDTATVVGKDSSGTWYAIETTRTSSGVAWIAGLVATFNGDTASLPIVAAPPPPAATATSRAPTAAPNPGGGPVTGQRGISGQLSLCNAKTTYGTNERICFVERIHNNNAAPVSYGILGVQASSLSGGGGQFQTSWSADLAPGGVLWIDPGCDGPTDRCKGAWEDGMTIRTPGTYRLVLSVCFSDFPTCLGTSGAWETLSQPIVVSIQ